ncbi:hypothetical protein BDK92_0278 [Micromonospora pisi]|uniref:Uncharacterized protein n=1 Tax=Micromonospora pisi TaxID=589240 RepID=A0A495JAV1_9ACTN|nr:hypothetical protein BDK92_0278 [Micromonospora pisi]
MSTLDTTNGVSAGRRGSRSEVEPEHEQLPDEDR